MPGEEEGTRSAEGVDMGRTREAIRREAEKLLQASGTLRAPVSLRDVVSVLNLSLVEKAHEPFAAEAALTTVGDGRAIELNGPVSERRRRFTIAHEIGHFVLHPGRVAPERGGPTNVASGRQEREADAFAAELLMPEHLVRQATLEEGADPRRLADRFEVSEQAMTIRLQRLGLVERQSDLLPPSRGVL
jgi:Zn-dependent peptidase ImmA (M78 family)